MSDEINPVAMNWISNDDLKLALADVGHVLGPGKKPMPFSVGDLAAALLHLRKKTGKDSRRAEQIKKARWSVELALTKLDDAKERDDIDEDAIAERIAKWLESAMDPRLFQLGQVATMIREGKWRDGR